MGKQDRNKIGRLQFTLTLLVWLLLFAIPLLFGDFSNGINWNHVFKIWKEYSFLVAIFLVNRFIFMPQLFLKGKRWQYFISISGLVILFSFIMYFLQNSHLPDAADQLPPPHFDMGLQGPGPRGKGHGPGEFVPPFANLIIMSVLLIGFDSGLIFFSKWMQSEQNKINTEKESIKNKMAFLQTQISPHFFMNTLNNIHALVDIDTEEAKESIIKLSHLMSYMLYETQTNKVTIEKEMEFIKSYVELMKLRFSEEVEVILDIPDSSSETSIPPLLTISYIENAFKHGISYEGNSFIHIVYRIKDNRMLFSIKNTIHTKKVENKNSGIGLENARNRLDLIYANNYQLAINQTPENVFEVNLNIPL